MIGRSLYIVRYVVPGNVLKQSRATSLPRRSNLSPRSRLTCMGISTMNVDVQNSGRRVCSFLFGDAFTVAGLQSRCCKKHDELKGLWPPSVLIFVRVNTLLRSNKDVE